MAESVEMPVVDIALDSRLAEEAGYSDDSTVAKKKTNRKRRHGELTEDISIDTHVLIMLTILAC